ncbi:MAG: hypothetical protein IPG10_03815 [Flavobacteriales bacterium]|nr:hypothetical protein [Flavobacteriales bacterium]
MLLPMASYWRCIQSGVLVTLVSALPFAMAAQNDTVHRIQHTMYLELLGNSLQYGLAYDLSWRVGSSWMSAGAGASYLPDLDPLQEGSPSSSEFTLPVQWNWFHGKRRHWEHGLGVTYASGLDALGGTYDIHSDALWACIKPIAYRIQRPKGGFFFRAKVYLIAKIAEFNVEWRQYTAVYGEPHITISPFLGIDLGYTFRTKQHKPK